MVSPGREKKVGVEAPGIEPGSKSSFGKDSTCVALLGSSGLAGFYAPAGRSRQS